MIKTISIVISKRNLNFAMLEYNCVHCTIKYPWIQKNTLNSTNVSFHIDYRLTEGNNTRHFFLDNWSIQCQNWSNMKYSTPTNLRNSAAYADVAEEGVTGVFVTVTS